MTEATQIIDLEPVLKSSDFTKIKIASKESSRSFVRERRPEKKSRITSFRRTIEAVEPQSLGHCRKGIKRRSVTSQMA
jgi:hypothetical protein